MSDPEGRTGRPALLGLLTIFLASRAVLIIVALLVEANTPMLPGASASAAPLLRSLTATDGAWYVGIAANGYHVEPLRGAFHDYAFFPLYPFAIRIASALTDGNLALAGVIVSNIAFAGALVVFESVSRPILGARGVLIAAVFLTFAPGAVAFGMAYTDSLLLLLSLSAVLAAERRRYPLMGLLYALASLTRLPGVVLIVPLALTIAEQGDGRPDRRWLWLAGGPLALVGYLGYLFWLTGDPLAYPRAQLAWNNPPDTLGPPGMPSIPPMILIVILVTVVAIYLFQLVYLRTSRIPRAHAAYVLAGLIALAVTARIISMPRFLAVLWPFPWIFTIRRSRAFIAGTTALFVVGYIGFAFLNFTILAA
jgi:hypothetical protein